MTFVCVPQGSSPCLPFEREWRLQTRGTGPRKGLPLEASVSSAVGSCPVKRSLPSAALARLLEVGAGEMVGVRLQGPAWVGSGCHISWVQQRRMFCNVLQGPGRRSWSEGAHLGIGWWSRFNMGRLA